MGRRPKHARGDSLEKRPVAANTGKKNRGGRQGKGTGTPAQHGGTKKKHCKEKGALYQTQQHTQKGEDKTTGWTQEILVRQGRGAPGSGSKPCPFEETLAGFRDRPKTQWAAAAKGWGEKNSGRGDCAGVGKREEGAWNHGPLSLR